MNAEQVEHLIRFVQERLANDERAATQCTTRDWQFSGSLCQVHAEQENGSFRTIAWCANGYDDDFSNSIHIAAFDPARVLREVASKRRILAEVVTRIDELDRHLEADYGRGDNTSGESDLLLKLLAAPYDQHPEWDEAWRP